MCHFRLDREEIWAFDLVKKAWAGCHCPGMEWKGWDGAIDVYSHTGWALGTIVTSVQQTLVPLGSYLQGSFSMMAWYMSTSLQGSSLRRLWLHDWIPRRKNKLLYAL